MNFLNNMKFYKTLKEYSQDIWVTRQTASTRYKKGDTNLIPIPKGAKYLQIDSN